MFNRLKFDLIVILVMAVSLVFISLSHAAPVANDDAYTIDEDTRRKSDEINRDSDRFILTARSAKEEIKRSLSLFYRLTHDGC